MTARDHAETAFAMGMGAGQASMLLAHAIALGVHTYLTTFATPPTIHWLLGAIVLVDLGVIFSLAFAGSIWRIVTP